MLNINTWAPLFEVIKKREKLKVKFTVHINGTQRFRIWNGYCFIFAKMDFIKSKLTNLETTKIT